MPDDTLYFSGGVEHMVSVSSLSLGLSLFVLAVVIDVIIR